MSKAIGNNEKRFVFTRDQVLSVEDCMEDGPKKCQTMKSLVTWALKEFIPIENYKSDPRMLDFWNLLGKYSVNLGMEGVLEKVHHLGYFKNVPDFYLMWADYFGLKQDRENFDKIVQICEENCQIGDSECQEIFRHLVQKHFESDYNEGKTLDVIKMLADKSEIVKSDLTFFQHKKFPSVSTAKTKNIISDNTIIINKNESNNFNKNEIEKPKIKEVHILSNKLTAPISVPTCEEYSVYKDVTYTKSTTVQNTVKNRRISYYPGFDDVTLAGAHGKFSTDMFTSTPRRSVMPTDFEPLMEDFTEGNQFFDPPEQEEKREGVGLFGCQISDKTIIKGIGGEGGGGKLKKRLSFADENQREKERSKNTNPMAEAVERMKKAKNNPNELIRTLPQLKISSPINEDSEDLKTFDSPEFPSPFRKKKKGE
uniref:BUB1 N-terminal domain-containing protein n=1 Tax=Meloidogyne hapla TaxID=6305 RepID=A0A1I8BEM0_MELHA